MIGDSDQAKAGSDAPVLLGFQRVAGHDTDVVDAGVTLDLTKRDDAPGDVPADDQSMDSSSVSPYRRFQDGAEGSVCLSAESIGIGRDRAGPRAHGVSLRREAVGKATHEEWKE